MLIGICGLLSNVREQLRLFIDFRSNLLGNSIDFEVLGVPIDWGPRSMVATSDARHVEQIRDGTL